MDYYLVFQTEDAANAALEAIYANMVAAIGSPDLLDVTTGQEVPSNEITPEEAAQYEADNRRFPVFGTNAASGIKDSQTGYTTAWAVAQETLQSKWVFQKPDDTLLDGVTSYTIEPYDPNWFPQDVTNG